MKTIFYLFLTIIIAFIFTDIMSASIYTATLTGNFSKMTWSPAPTHSRVTLEVYNIIGERVAQLVNEEQSAGYYVVNFGTSSNNITSGIYIYKLTAADNTGKNFSSIKKMMQIGRA